MAKKAHAKPKGREESASGGWIETFSADTRAFEAAVDRVVREKPVPVFLAALAVGVASRFLYKALTENSAIPKTSPRAAGGWLTPEVVPALGRLGDVLTNLADEMAERPWPTVATAFSIGFGAGGLTLEQAKRGALGFAKRAAGRAFDEKSAIPRLEKTEPHDDFSHGGVRH